MWTCPRCNRMFRSNHQPHSCNTVSVESHFEHKEQAKALFSFLRQQIEDTIGPCGIVSLPCCVHLFGFYDFLAALPKKDGMEIRFALNRKLESTRLKTSVPISKSATKNCIDLRKIEEIDRELLEWVEESYHLKD